MRKSEIAKTIAATLMTLAANQAECDPAISLEGFGRATVLSRSTGQYIEVAEMHDDEFMHEDSLARGFTEEELKKGYFVVMGRRARFRPAKDRGFGNYDIELHGSKTFHTYAIPGEEEGSFRAIRLNLDADWEGPEADRWYATESLTSLELWSLMHTIELTTILFAVQRHFQGYDDFLRAAKAQVGAERWLYFEGCVLEGSIIGNLTARPMLYNGGFSSYVKGLEKFMAGQPLDSSLYQITQNLDPDDHLKKLEKLLKKIGDILPLLLTV